MGRWPALQTFRLNGPDPEDIYPGPDSEEQLEQQRQLLLEACKVVPALREVRFQGQVAWGTDADGHWTAVYHGSHQKTLAVLTPLDYLPAEKVIARTIGECDTIARAIG